MLSIGRIDRDAVNHYYGEYENEQNPGVWIGEGARELGLEPGSKADQEVVSALLAGGRMTAEVIHRARIAGRPAPVNDGCR